MPPLALTVVATLSAQAVGALLLALLLRHFHRRYDEPYLRHWSASWAAYAVFLVSAAAALALAPRMAAGTWPRLTLAVAGSLAAYLQLLWLVQGARALAAGGAVWPRLLRRALPLLVVAAVATTLAFAWDPGAGGMRYFLRVGGRAAVGTVAFLAAAWLVLRARPGGIRSGPRLVAWSFFVFGLQQAHYFTVATLGLWRVALPYTSYLGFVDLLLQWVMGLGMVVCLLEDERAAAAHASARAEHLALHDVLTGLPNRALFADRLSAALRQAVRSGERVAVLFLDLDRFKLVNDSLGHTAGDTLLREVGRRLAATVRGGDTVARVGGDEFTLLFPGLARGEDAGGIARKLLDAVREPVEVEGRELLVTASVGIAVFPDDGPDAETLVQRADAAMYGAKEAGRDRLQFSSTAMVARAAEQLALESALRRGVAAGDLVVHYQPILDARTGETYGVEALVRWLHPERGLLPPADFIPLSEQMGIAHRIGVHVLRDACAQTARWRAAGHPRLCVAVNLAADHFKDPHLVEEVLDALAAAGLPAQALELEITESVAMENADASMATLHRLKGLGVRISIDDFGTGYSSLSYLKRFPVDTLKVDRSLVADVHRDRGDAAIVATVVTLAQSLGMQVVAEGVETEAQLFVVRELDCDLVQGYLFGRPAPPEQVEPLLRRAPAAA